ncbi:4-coumarate-CoA ligase 1 [Smittium mucronatum]|uniref:4-coumarate-CoA ligase 1 n=1 Tax=Smittium mucronatum TaxID=133383 RepID=A0A1R0H4Z5_9FUNG|nr:4-coumarate-CoA ligase 1 [Smittium mucronatum]
MIFKSQLPSLDFPNIDIPQYCFTQGKINYAMARNRTKFALCDGPTGKTFNIEQVEAKSTQFASGLANKLGFKRDEVLALYTPNTIYYPIVVYGTLMTGGIVTLANPNYTARELAFQLKDSNSKAVATQSDLIPVVKEAISIAKLNILDSDIIILDTVGKSGSSYVHIEQFLTNLPFKAFEIGTKEEAENKVAVLPYSSGTTGLPKGVMLTHKNIVSNIIMNSCFAVNDNWIDRSVLAPTFVGVLPFYHIYGFVSILNLGIAMSIGLVVMPKFESNKFLSIIQDYKITFGHIVPPIIMGLINNPDIGKYDISSMKAIRTASAPLGEKALNKFFGIFKNIGVVRAYGLTETSPTLCNSYKDHENDGSSGVLLHNLEAKVIDPDGNLLGYNQPGELCFRGPTIMKGYLNNIEATTRSIDSDGFFHTGDVGFVTESNDFHVIDRIKELIKYKGFQVAPAELESLLLSHPDIADCAVIGIYDEDQATELPKAFVTLAPNNSKLSESQKLAKIKQMTEWLNSQVAPHKKLRGGMEVLDNIPKSQAGKILKNVLKNNEKAKRQLSNLNPRL